MKLKISQRAEAFFDQFSQSARNIRETSELLQDLIEDYQDVDLKVRRIQDREHEGDEITHAIIRRLNTSFITPMDREDIYHLATALDDVLDAMEAVSDLLLLHAIEEPLPVMKAQVDVLVRAARQTEEALSLLAKMDRQRRGPTGSRSTAWRTRATSSTAAPSRSCSAATTRRWTSCGGKR
jgi:hypothetical protein